MSAGKPHSLEQLQRTRRIAVCFRAEFSGRHVRGSGTVQNISATGALIEDADPPLLAGGDIQIRFPFFDESVPVELNARVVRETERGFAVRFVSLDRRMQQVLAFAISRASVRPPDDTQSSATPLLQQALGALPAPASKRTRA